MDAFDLHKIEEYREGNRLEAKAARRGLPGSLWETYSAFANTEGGIILLGVSEDADHSLHVSGVTDALLVVKNLWDTLNNSSKISVNILTDRMVSVESIDGKEIIVIKVPRAERTMRPVYIGKDPMTGTYKRNGEGDYKCTKEQVAAMFRDALPYPYDTKIIEGMDMSVFNSDTVRSYRNYFEVRHPVHIWNGTDDEIFLRRLGAIALSKEDGKFYPTAAGLLMFGNEYDIVREFPQYFLDYQERMDPNIRWTYRLDSNSGEWSGNVFDFFLRIYSRLVIDLPKPFELDNNDVRIDDTGAHKAVREALTNALANADYYGRRGIVVIKTPEYLSFANPGDIRIGLDLAMSGGESDPRNGTIMKMFRLLNIGERTGTGIPTIIANWEEKMHRTPEYKFSNDDISRTKLILPLNEEVMNKVVDKSGEVVNKVVNKSGEVVNKVVNKSDEVVNKPLNSTQLKIMQAIENEPDITYARLIQVVGISKTAVQNGIEYLKANDYLRRDGSKKNGHWVILKTPNS